MSEDHHPAVLAYDAGGTMTDAFIVDADGAFVIGKALSTPEDESKGAMASLVDGLKHWGSRPRTARARFGRRSTRGRPF